MEDKGKYKRMTFSFTEADSDIVEYLETLKKSGKASEYVREAIREKMKNDIKSGDSLEDTIRGIVKEVLSEHQTPPPQNNDNFNLNKVKQQDNDLNNAVLNAIDSFDF